MQKDTTSRLINYNTMARQRIKSTKRLIARCCKGELIIYTKKL